MKFSIITYLLLTSSLFSLGQNDSSKVFESSKGKWQLPLPRYLKIYDNEELKHFAANQFDSTLRIITDSSYQVKAVHDGRIFSIIEIEGEYSILTKFGSYFLAYSRLTKPSLKEGEFVKAGQSLGNLVKNWTEENYTLEIMLSKDDKQLSAEKWIIW